MQEIPDTGGGPSGFVAWLLWRVYVYFPFEGTWDWLLLFILLAVLTRLGAMRSSWKLIKWMASRARAKRSEPVYALVLHNVFTQTGVMLFFVWFFSADVGRTFLVARTWSGGVPVLGANTAPLLWIGFLLLTGCAAAIAFGVLLHVLGFPQEAMEHPAEMLFGSSILHFTIVMVAYLVCLRGSRASLILMYIFTLIDWLTVIRTMFRTAPALKHGKT